MQPQPTDSCPQPGASWFIDQWLQRLDLPATTPTTGQRRKLEMTTPPTSRGRPLSPSKRRRLNSAAEDAGFGDSEKIARPAVSDSSSLSGTAFVTRADLRPRVSGSASLTSVRELSVTGTSTVGSAAQQSRSRSTSPIKTTSTLRNLEKPVYFPAMTESAVARLPADTQELYERLVDITNQEEIMPLSIRDDIYSIIGGRYRSARFYHDQGMLEEGSVTQKRSDPVPSAEDNPRLDGHDTARAANDDLPPPTLSYPERRQRRQLSPRAVALTELDTLVDLTAAANNCRVLGRHEATWNLEVHYPLFRLALDRPEYTHVLVEPVTHAFIAPPFLPSWDPALGRGPRETVGSKKLDFALALFVDPGIEREQYGWVGRQREVDAALGEAIREVVREVPVPLGINQLAYDPLRYSPIAIGVETKTDANLEDGRRQLGVYTAAWHRRMSALMADRPHMSGKRIVTLPLLLIVEHEWRLSFAVDMGDAINILTDMAIGNTRTVTGMYMITAALRELAKWIGSHFRDWISLLFAPPTTADDLGNIV